MVVGSNPEEPVFTVIFPDAARILSVPGLLLNPILVPAVADEPIVV